MALAINCSLPELVEAFVTELICPNLILVPSDIMNRFPQVALAGRLILLMISFGTEFVPTS